MRATLLAVALAFFAGMVGALPALAADALTVRAGPPESTANREALELARTIDADPHAGLSLSVEASAGSRQNILEAPLGGADALFTAVPGMVERALLGAKPFAAAARYGDIRALFPLPFPSLHWAVRADSGVSDFAGLAGRPFMPGRPGSFAAAETDALFRLLGIAGKVKPVEHGTPLALLSADAVVGFAVATAVPDREIARLAQTVPIRLLSLGRDRLDKMLAADDELAAMVIPAHTYAGIDSDVLTVGQPIGLYATVRLSDADAYRLTRAFWQRRKALAEHDPAWAAITPETLVTLAVKLHPGALRYYDEAGVPVPPGLR